MMLPGRPVERLEDDMTGDRGDESERDSGANAHSQMDPAWSRAHNR
jgi:hypothetical protein